MDAVERNTYELSDRPAATQVAAPRFGGVLWRISRRTNRFGLLLAGSRWNPIFAIVEHRGRRSGRTHRTPVAARRVGNGFVISLAFGAHVAWYRNLVAAGCGTLRWRGVEYPIGAPQVIDAVTGRAAFHPIQRLFLRLARIDGYVFVRDFGSSPR
jgi:deazaflavin-dependent oxidoreductase (nitroreductase family)